MLGAGCLVSHHRHHFRSVIVICQEVDTGQWLDDGDNVEVDTGHGNEGGDRVLSTEYRVHVYTRAGNDPSRSLRH